MITLTPEIQSSMRWYAVWTRARHEKVVKDQLAMRSIEAFLPTVTQWSRWKDRRRKIDWPLFPGYCFARFNLYNRLPVLKCAGVLNIVSFGHEPVAVPDAEVDSLRVLTGTDLHYDPCPLISDGAIVEVVHGPLQGVIGRLRRKDTKRATVVLSIDLIGKAVTVQVEAADIAPCSQPLD